MLGHMVARLKQIILAHEYGHLIVPVIFVVGLGCKLSKVEHYSRKLP